MTDTLQKSAGLPAITPDAAKQKLSIALTKATYSIQSLQDEADSLVFNEDQENIDKMKSFLEKGKKMTKTIEEEHKVIKEPYLEGGRACDTAKKDMTQSVMDVISPVQNKYTDICNKIDREKRDKEAKEAEEKRIKDGIESNVLSFSQQIAACATKKELNDVERLINLEKSPTRSSKYGDHHQKAIDRYNEVLIPILKDQKTKIEEKEKLEEELRKTDDPEKYDEVKEKLEQKENEIVQNQVRVQEDALKQESEAVIEAEVILPTVKTSRVDMSCEIVDVSQAFKKCPELLNIELKLADAKKLGNTLKEAGAFGDKDEIIVNGIKYSIKKKW
jgi:hypothetical protein